ncbi:hypothetical protein DWB61_01480 [Ancylomarina euxinus]|uniref:Uncharacterized protein n=1 Tax=Ancylomarina euxinus TaxID=2283627 RepID=A0A425Y813_9BACT|nr:hypothetical protein [Ancylomarina euxinus]MCZ4693416.1 hypothetical protein [Ancylomarina euxinus]MUP13643.1 hypothetical protein [Ancylomarina euxinus]RRG24715.1 hypothetical protein DWB61_01480 [Ancylomarina euxinus]
MKREINRIMIICMLIGFCISPTILKSQLIQANNSISILLESSTQYTYSKWFSLEYFFKTDWSSDENEISKGDSLKNKLEIKFNRKGTKDSLIPELNRRPVLKIKKNNFRNKPIIIQTRI